MFEGELWLKRLAVEVKLSIDESRTLWQLFVCLLGEELSENRTICLGNLGQWSISLENEFLATILTKKYLMPPCIKLQIETESPSIISYPFELQSRLKEDVAIDRTKIQTWLETIPILTEQLMNLGYQVFWPGLGIWQIQDGAERQYYTFEADKVFLLKLNRPFAYFRPEEVVDMSSIKGLETRGLDNPEEQESSNYYMLSLSQEEIRQSEEGGLPLKISRTKPDRLLYLMLMIIFVLLSTSLSFGLYKYMSMTSKVQNWVGEQRFLVKRSEKSIFVEQEIIPDILLSKDSNNLFRNNAEIVKIDTSSLIQSLKKTLSEPQKKIDTLDIFAKANKSEYIVFTKGDSLSALAQRKYGNKVFWVYIYEENREFIPHPHNIEAGIKLHLPPALKYGIDPNSPKSLRQAKVLSRCIDKEINKK